MFTQQNERQKKTFFYKNIMSDLKNSFYDVTNVTFCESCFFDSYQGGPRKKNAFLCVQAFL